MASRESRVVDAVPDIGGECLASVGGEDARIRKGDGARAPTLCRDSASAGDAWSSSLRFPAGGRASVLQRPALSFASTLPSPPHRPLSSSSSSSPSPTSRMAFAPKPGCPMCGIVASAVHTPAHSPLSPTFPRDSGSPEVLYRDDNFTVYRERANPVSSKGHLIFVFKSVACSSLHDALRQLIFMRLPL